MLGGARAGASEVSSHGSGEQLGGPFLAFGGRHRRLAGARLGGGWADQRECSDLWMRQAEGCLCGISPQRSRLHELTLAFETARTSRHMAPNFNTVFLWRVHLHWPSVWRPKSWQPRS